MKTNILYVDEQTEWRQAAAIFLEAAGFDVLRAKDGGEAMYCADSQHVAAIILEADLPGEDPATLIGYLQANAPDAPIILYTGLDRDADRVQRSLSAGAAQYLRKGNLSRLAEFVKERFLIAGGNRWVQHSVLQFA